MRSVSFRPGRALALAVSLSLVAASCGDDDTAAPAASTDSSADSTSDTDGAAEPGADEGTGGQFAAENYTTDLTGVCPETVVVQTDWFPEPEHGAMYQLIGANGEVDASQGRYKGPLGSTGVDLEVRAGGPFLGQQTVPSIMYQDDAIMLGFVSTDAGIQFSDQLPTTAVVSPLENNPQILMWDPEAFDDIETFEDIAAAEAPILVFSKDNSYVQYLIGKGLIPEGAFDDSYDGSPSRFVTEKVFQQGFATNEPFKYENDIENWQKPVDFLLISESGYEIYSSSLAVKTGDIEDLSDCLTGLVPLIQQAQIDFIEDPAEVNEELLRIVEELDTFWTLSAPGNDDAVATMLDLGIVSNGDDGTLGDFDEARVQRMIDELTPIFSNQGIDSFDPDLTASDLVDNQFIDPDIGL